MAERRAAVRGGVGITTDTINTDRCPESRQSQSELSSVRTYLLDLVCFSFLILAPAPLPSRILDLSCTDRVKVLIEN